MADLTYSVSIDTSGAQNSLNNLNKDIGKIGNTLKGIAGAFAGAFAVQGLVQTAARFESLRTSLSILYKDAQLGAQAFDNIKTLAAETVFSVDDLTEAYIKLLSAGIEPTRDQLKLFADVSSVAADSVGALKAITDLYARTTAGGLGLEDLNRLADRGIPVFNILADKLGLTRLEVSKFGQSASGAAKILQTLEAELQKTFGGASVARANTLSQAIANVSDSFNNLIDRIAQAGPGNELTKTLQGLSAALNAITPEHINTLIDSIKSLVTILGSLLVIGKIAPLFANLTLAMTSFGKGAKSAGMAAAALPASFKSAADGISILTRTGTILAYQFGKITSAGSITVATINGLAKRFGFLLIGLTRFVPILGQVTAAFYALDTALELLTGRDISSWLNKLNTDFDIWINKTIPFISQGLDGIRSLFSGGMLGFMDPVPPRLFLPKEEADSELKRIQNRDKALKTSLTTAQSETKKLADDTQKLTNYYSEQKLAIDQSVSSLKASLGFTQSQLQLENEILNKKAQGIIVNEDQVELMKTMQNLERDRAQAVGDLQDKLDGLRLQYLNLTETQKAAFEGQQLKVQIDLIMKQIAEVQKLYGEHNKGMSDLITANNNLKSIEAARKQIQEDMLRIIDEQSEKQFALAEVFKELDGELKKTNQDLEQMNMSPFEKQISDINIRVNDMAQNAREKFAEAFGEITPANMDEFEAGMVRINQTADELKAKLMGMAETSRSFEFGWNQAFKSYMDESTNAAKQAGDIFSSVTSNMNSAIDNFTRTGKFKFKDFALSIIRDILAIQLKAEAAKIFGGGGGGGIFGFLGGLFGGGGGGFGTGSMFGNLDFGGFFANGGTPPMNKPSLVGERGPELFVPRTNGSIVPNDQLNKGIATGAVNAPVTNNYITNNISAIDAKSVAQLFADNRKTLLGTVEMARRESPYGG